MEDADTGTQRARVLRVATRCTSPDQFVEAFARFCDGRTLFVSSLSTRPIGTRLPFVILLADGTRAMRGQCEVIESYANPGNVYRRPGVKLALTELDDDSESMLGKLQVARRFRDARSTSQMSAVGVEPTTERRAASTTGLPSLGPSAPSGPSGPVAVPPPAPPPPRAPVPPRAATGSKVPALPPLPRFQADRRVEAPASGGMFDHGPAAPSAVPQVVQESGATARPDTGEHWLQRAREPLGLPRRSSPPAPPPPTDATDAGWGDDDGRPARPRTVPPPAQIVDDPEADDGQPRDDDSTPALVIAAATDHAGAAAVAAAGDAGDAVPVVELISRSQGNRRDSGRFPTRASTASGRVERSSQVSISGRSAPTPGDVYSGEERTPGSAFILPANPLSQLTDESLQGFIDCTIYEDHTQPTPVASDPAISGSQLGIVEDPELAPDFRPVASGPYPGSSPVIASARSRSGSMRMSGELGVPPVSGDHEPIDPSVEPERWRGGTPPPAPPVELVRPRAGSQPPVSGVFHPRPPSQPPVSGAFHPRPLSQPLSSVDDDEDEDEGLPPPSAIAAATAAQARPPTPPPPLPPRPGAARIGDISRPDWMAPAPDPASPRPRIGTRPPPKPKRTGWLVPAVVLGGLLAAAAVLYLLYRDRAAREAAREPVATVTTDAAVIADAPVDAGAGPDASAIALGTVDAGVVAPLEVPDAGTATIDGCRVQVTTTPAGASVILGKQALGASPIDAEVDCGAAVLSARLPRYQLANRQVTLVAGTPAVVRIKLARPNHNLTVLSTPRGATVTVGGRRVGKTPLSIEVPGFSRHAVTIELPGYQTHRTSVTTDDQEQTVAVPLVKLP